MVKRINKKKDEEINNEEMNDMNENNEKLEIIADFENYQDPNIIVKMDLLTDEISNLVDELTIIESEIYQKYDLEYEKEMKRLYLKRSELNQNIKYKKKLKDFWSYKCVGNDEEAKKLLGGIRSN